jgi:hypothetical protein
MRPNEREFLSQVLESVKDLPEGLSERLLRLVDQTPDALGERADAIRRLLEESSRD